MSLYSSFSGGSQRGAHVIWSSVAFADPMVPTTVIDPLDILGSFDSTGTYTAAGNELWAITVHTASITSAGVFSFVTSNGLERGFNSSASTSGQEWIVPLAPGDTLKFKGTLGNSTASVSLLRLSA